MARVYRRPQCDVLARRLAEPRRFIQVVAGARQVGKTTLVQQVTDACELPVRFVSADEPTLRGPDWIEQPLTSRTRLRPAAAPSRTGASAIARSTSWSPRGAA
jgi:hypothetical protein